MAVLKRDALPEAQGPKSEVATDHERVGASLAEFAFEMEILDELSNFRTESFVPAYYDEERVPSPTCVAHASQVNHVANSFEAAVQGLGAGLTCKQRIRLRKSSLPGPRNNGSAGTTPWT
mmetsp:Transcript_34591/g.71419  ORF Transcript_34591/g.71419 Transcript_34591/m.71419 type:complete len:120 (-) Transcript_34591:66-425(-)